MDALIRPVAALALIGFACLSTIAAADDEEEIAQGGRRIVGGEATDIKKHPWQVAIDVKGGLCGGSIIADRWVLTAAHCFKASTVAEDVKVKTGVTNIVDDGTWNEIERLIVHPDYSRTTKENDLALLKIKSRTGGSIIPLARDTTFIAVGQPLEVTGWGHTAEKGQRSKVLMKASVPLVSNNTCNEPASYDGKILEHMMCAGHKDGGIDSCQGDSGGPLVLRSWSGPTLVGVVSWGKGCAQKLKYGVYSRVADYRDWISGTIKANN